MRSVDMVSPSLLRPDDFKGYPPLASKMAVENIPLFQEMPITFLALLLRELINWDWKFPAERRDLDRQLSFLRQQSREQRGDLFKPFAQLRLSPELENIDWVNAPAQFSEQLSSHLWATHQIDAFHTAAIDFFSKVGKAVQPEPIPAARLGIVVLGQGVETNKYPLFRKLRAQGTYFTNVEPRDGLQAVVKCVELRAAAYPGPFSHFYIDGATNEKVSGADVACVSYGALTSARAMLQEKMRTIFESGTGSEAFRSILARMRPEDVGISSATEPVLSRFEVSLLTEGSGTQIFSTAFVQWAAREALRRAQPVTLLARFTPRQKERPMRELLTEAQGKPALDPQGSLIDADMGAYYTWVNMQRLAEAERASFVGWFENGREAIAIGPAFSRGTVSAAPATMRDILSRTDPASVHESSQ